MTTTLFHVGKAFTPRDEIADAGILVREGIIEALGPRAGMTLPAGAKEISEPGAIAAPGFVDVHIHGAGGHDVMEGTAEALDVVTQAVLRHGTTSFVATTVTASPEATCKSAEGITRYISSQKKRGGRGSRGGAEILGIHFEGPFLSPARRGVHPPEWLRLPSEELLQKFLAAAGGMGRIITLAPELLGAAPCIAAARQAGMTVSLGHTDANFEQARAAIACGACHGTHVYNAMRPFSHRDAGVIGAVLSAPEVTAELIADGVHVDEGAMRLLLAAKGPERVILVSDGIAATGMPDGNYTLGTIEVTVSGGICRNAEGKLAGSTLTLDRALRNIVALEVPLADALRMLTANPAKLVGLEGRKGSLRLGADADIVLLDSALRIRRVIARGADAASA